MSVLWGGGGGMKNSDGKILNGPRENEILARKTTISNMGTEASVLRRDRFLN